MDQKPSIGRIVHYTNLGDAGGKYPPSVQAAIITGVYREAPTDESGLEPANAPGDAPDAMLVDLHIFYRTGQFDMQRVPWAFAPTRGYWNWPPRV